MLILFGDTCYYSNHVYTKLGLDLFLKHYAGHQFSRPMSGHKNGESIGSRADCLLNQGKHTLEMTDLEISLMLASFLFTYTQNSFKVTSIFI